jgi:hypothetical protein
MARPSKLTEKQWLTIAERMASGESVRSLAREYKLSESTIRERLSAQTERVKAVANQILATERELRALPISAQITAHNLADQLRSISSHLASAANYGAATAHRLSGIAHAKVEMIDDSTPLDENSVGELKGISVLTRMANAASEIGVNLLRANKEHVDALNERERSDSEEKKDSVPLRPQLTKNEWMIAHGVGTAAGSAK